MGATTGGFMKINKNMIIADVLELDRGTIPIFMESGLHCLGCIMASGESIAEASMVHGIDCDDLVDKLNQYFASKEM